MSHKIAKRTRRMYRNLGKPAQPRKIKADYHIADVGYQIEVIQQRNAALVEVLGPDLAQLHPGYYQVQPLLRRVAKFLGLQPRFLRQLPDVNAGAVV